MLSDALAVAIAVATLVAGLLGGRIWGELAQGRRPTTSNVVELFIEHPDWEMTAFELTQLGNFKPGSIYPVLRSLERQGHLARRRDDTGENPRHYYRWVPIV